MSFLLKLKILFKTLPPELQVFIISLLPVIELRGGIPYGIGILGKGAFFSFVWAVLGNIFPVFFILKFLDPVINWIFKHIPFLEKHIKQYFEKLHVKHSGNFNKWGAFFLALFVAVPLPGTGAWTGALLAYLFNIPFWLAFGSISLGVIGAGFLVAFFSEAVAWML
ncbi:small multi-drug export protein [Candidatus Peregrinibacteria bacterium]|nr:small multi-drug export protein [Candidatus Peregrinibacteria bacterium]